MYCDRIFVVPDNSISYDIILDRDLIEQKININYNMNGLLLTRSIQICDKIKNVIEMIDTDLPLNAITELYNLLLKFKNNFIDGLPSRRVTSGKLDIRLKDSNKFVQRRPYRLSTEKREIVREIIDS